MIRSRSPIRWAAEPTWKDWERLAETCFENREADIGRFLRRHLGGISPETIQQLAAAFAQAEEPGPDQVVSQLLAEGAARFNARLAATTRELPEHGYFDVALVVAGEAPPHQANLDFLNLLTSSNPQLTGWPIWLDSRDFRVEESRPRVVNAAWEAFVLSVQPDWNNHLDFWILDPRGRFYLRRALQDDFTGRTEAPEPLSCLDFGLAILLVGEAIAVGVEFGKALGYSPDDSDLHFMFQWTRLQGRTLASWTNRGRHISPGRQAYQDEVKSKIVVPLGVAPSALARHVHRATAPLFQIFGGFELGANVTEDLTRQLLERRL